MAATRGADPGRLPRIANARMYSMTPATHTAWHALMNSVLARAGLDWRVEDHAPPAGIDQLWSRPDLGLVQICGLPFAQGLRRQPGRYQPVASPVTRTADGGARYRSYLVVRADSAHASLRDTFGGVAGFTVTHSQSGYAALLAALQPYVQEAAGPVYRLGLGGFNGYRAGLQALARQEVDLLPVDSYVYDLLALHEPALTSGFRVVQRTPFTPAPLFAADGSVAQADIARLRQALAAWVRDPASEPVRDALLLEDFAFPAASEYEGLAHALDALEAAPRPWRETRRIDTFRP